MNCNFSITLLLSLIHIFIRAPLDEQNFETVFLKTETWIAIVSRQHPLAGQTGVSLERLSREPLFIPSRQPLQSEILNWFSSASESYQIFALYNQLAGIIPLIAQNTGVAICPESVKLYTDCLLYTSPPVPHRMTENPTPTPMAIQKKISRASSIRTEPEM